jgi:methionyl-tRNA synthetase
VIPEAAGRLLDQMGIPAEGRTFAALADEERYARLVASGFRLDLPKPIFPRLEYSGEAA